MVVGHGALRPEDLDCGGGLAVAEQFGGVAVHGVAEPVIVAEDGGAEASREGVVAAADVDRGDLAVVADIDDLAVDRIDCTLQRQAGAGGAHGGLVEHHDHATRQGAAAMVEFDQEPVDGCRVGNAALRHQLGTLPSETRSGLILPVDAAAGEQQA
jgi:hypothetical protein